MKRNRATYLLADKAYTDIKRRMLNWANQFSILLFLDSNSYDDSYGRYECLLATGDEHSDKISSLDELGTAHTDTNDWWFGHICYDYKNELEPKLASAHAEVMGFPQFRFFRPQTVCYISRGQKELTIETIGVEPDSIYEAILSTPLVTDVPNIPSISFQKRINKEEYLQCIDTLRRHIADGDCYEINFCNEGFSSGVAIEPLTVFHALNRLSPAPFAAYYKSDSAYLMCSSPERYLHKTGNTILSQPIKGTIKRGGNEAEDKLKKDQLYNSEKDRAENVMIVDLVRNDLARSCETGSVKVDELFGIYTYPQVHQMTSTISGKLKNDTGFADAIKYSFPMGSMTGAPKVKVMQLIEQYEHSRRELFSGTVGYISPEGDFDFNVVIRSLFYNSRIQYLSYQTGGAITYDSDPLQEWEEMRLKAWAMERIFS